MHFYKCFCKTSVLALLDYFTADAKFIRRELKFFHMAEYEYEVEMRGISKSFAGVKALQNVDFCIKHGEIHALMGENGAGKSTLIRCLSGVGPADSGTIKLRGKEVKIANPKDGIQNGISVIYQEFALVQHLTVAENILLDDFREGGAFVNWKKMREKAKAALDDLGFSQIDVNTKVADLSVAYQQVVEICKALIRNASVLVLDEPTAVMTNAEVEQLFVLIDRLKKRGVSIVYVSHRLDEIFRISDRITVLKDGEYVDTVNTADIDSSRLVAMMIGRDLATFFPPRVADIGDVVLRAEHLSAGHAVKDISFEVRAGEVLGLAGLVGAGRTEAIRAMLGVDRLDSGNVYLNDKEIHLRSTKDAYAHGIGFLPEDRKNQGVLLRLPIYQNVSISAMDKITTTLGIIQGNKERKLVKDYVEALRVKTASVKNPVSSLSGGNQQKVALAKILATDSKVLILDEPTRGVDVGAKIEIFKIINELVAQRYAVIMISSEMAEIIGMCDRAVVIREGKSMGVLEKDELSEINIINLAMGIDENRG